MENIKVIIIVLALFGLLPLYNRNYTNTKTKQKPKKRIQRTGADYPFGTPKEDGVIITGFVKLVATLLTYAMAFCLLFLAFSFAYLVILFIKDMLS